MVPMRIRLDLATPSERCAARAPAGGTIAAKSTIASVPCIRACRLKARLYVLRFFIYGITDIPNYFAIPYEFGISGYNCTIITLSVAECASRLRWPSDTWTRRNIHLDISGYDCIIITFPVIECASYLRWPRGLAEICTSVSGVYTAVSRLEERIASVESARYTKMHFVQASEPKVMSM